jgi:hypothetical protein
MKDRIQSAASLFVGGIITHPRKQIAEAEEAAHQRSATGSQKAEALTIPRASNDGLGFVLENHRLRGDSPHSSRRVTRRSGVPGLGRARPSKLLDCRWRLPAASKAAHAPTLSPSTTCRPACDLFGIAKRPCGHVALLRQGYESGATPWRQGYGCGATMTRSEVVDKITKAMQSSAPITTARVEMPPALTGASGG